jgi:hypothetical protein
VYNDDEKKVVTALIYKVRCNGVGEWSCSCGTSCGAHMVSLISLNLDLEISRGFVTCFRALIQCPQRTNAVQWFARAWPVVTFLQCASTHLTWWDSTGRTSCLSTIVLCPYYHPWPLTISSMQPPPLPASWRSQHLTKASLSQILPALPHF